MATSQRSGPSRSAEKEEESDASLLCTCPTMELLFGLVVPRVSSRWDYVGLQLGVSSELLQVIEREQFMKMGDCCTAMLEHWLRGAPGTGSEQRSWESVLRAVEVGHGTEAKGEIREGLREAAVQPDYQPSDLDDKAWFSSNQLAQMYLEHVRDTYSEMSITGEYPHPDYIKLRVIESQPLQHKKDDTIQFLRNFQKATVDFISQRDRDRPLITPNDQPASGLLSHDHFLQKQEKPLHIVFGPPGVGKTSFSRQICSQFNSAPQSSAFSLVLLFFLREKRVAEAKSLSDLLSCYGLPDDLDHKQLARLIAKNKGSGIQIIFDGLDERQDLLKDEMSIVTRLLKGELKEAQILVTSRPGIVTQLSKLWHRASLYEVQGFSPQEVKQYIESFFLKEGDPSAVPKLLLALADRPDLTGSTYIPLNLWLICCVFSFKNCTLPNTLTQCYTALFAQLLQRQAKKEGLEIVVGDTLENLPDSMLATLDCLSQLSYLCFLKEELVFDEEMVISTCLSSCAELKATFDGMSLLHVHPKKHGVKDHLTFNFLHSTYQEYLCARHILTAMSEEEQTAFWKENINNPRFAMVFRFYCGLSQLQIKGVQEIVKGQELPNKCGRNDYHLLFLFYALHESGNTHLTADVASRLDSELTFSLLFSPYDFYVMQFCLSKTAHLRSIKLSKRTKSSIYQSSESAVPGVLSVASTNHLTFLELGLSDFTLSDAQHFTAALVVVENLELALRISSIEAVEELLLLPNLKQLTLDVKSFSNLQTTPHPKSVSNVRQLYLTLPPEGDTCLAQLICNCPLVEKLTLECNSKSAGDVAAALPKLKCLRKVIVWKMNPVPVLQTVDMCGKMQEVSIFDPKHCKPTTEDWFKVSSSLATAQHLKKLELVLFDSDVKFLRSCLFSLNYSQSLQELVVRCNASGVGDVVATALPNMKCLRKVKVSYANPVPVLQVVDMCEKLQEVAVWYPEHCESTTEDWFKVSSSLAVAQHLKKVELRLFSSDINFLKSCLSCLILSQSLQELDVTCNASGAGEVLAGSMWSLHSVEKLSICDIDPVPLLHVLSHAEHCSVSTLSFALDNHPELGVGMSDMLSKCKRIRAFELYLNKGPEFLNVLNSCLEGVCHSSSIERLSISCLDAAAGPAVAHLLPNVVGRLVKLSVSLSDPMEVLEELQEGRVACLTLDISHLRYMTPQDQLRLKALLSGVNSQVSVVFQHELQFPYQPWIDPRISPGISETMCVCTGLSENPHIRGTEVSGVPPGLLSEVQCLLMKNPSCHSITVNGETLRQVEPSDDQSFNEESFGFCEEGGNTDDDRD